MDRRVESLRDANRCSARRRETLGRLALRSDGVHRRGHQDDRPFSSSMSSFIASSPSWSSRRA